MPSQNRSPDTLEIVTSNGQLSRIQVATYVSTGKPEDGRQPGVSIDLVLSEKYRELLINPTFNNMNLLPAGETLIQGGVLSRDQVRDLRNILTLFLLDFPEEEPL